MSEIKSILGIDPYTIIILSRDNDRSATQLKEDVVFNKEMYDKKYKNKDSKE